MLYFTLPRQGRKQSKLSSKSKLNLRYGARDYSKQACHGEGLYK